MALQDILTHRAVRLALSFMVGLAIAFVAYERMTDPEPRQQRRLEESVVLDARAQLRDVLALPGNVSIVDPVDTDRKVGKVYIYPEGDGWQVSGYYRREGEMRWHPWLMNLGASRELLALKIQDSNADVVARAAADPRIEMIP